MKTIYHKGRSVSHLQEEKEIEDDFAEYAASKGVAAKKFIDQGTRGAPDRICLCPKRHVFFIEFKKPGEKPHPLQVKYHENLRELGFKVYVFDNLQVAKHALDYEISDKRE